MSLARWLAAITRWQASSLIPHLATLLVLGLMFV
jgi:hypothetical protein